MARFKNSDCWKYFDDTYKIFVPSVLIKPFEQWTKCNYFEAKMDATYNYLSSRVKKKTPNAEMHEGKTYIIKSDNVETILKWVKARYKEIK